MLPLNTSAANKGSDPHGRSSAADWDFHRTASRGATSNQQSVNLPNRAHWRSVEDSNLCDVAAGLGLAIRPLTCSGNAPCLRFCLSVHHRCANHRRELRPHGPLLAPTEGLEPSDPCGQRFSRPLRYQLRYKSAYGGLRWSCTTRVRRQLIYSQPRCYLRYIKPDSRIYWVSAGGPSLLFYAPIQCGEIGRPSPRAGPS